jgi:hypothetical protein
MYCHRVGLQGVSFQTNFLSQSMNAHVSTWNLLYGFTQSHGNRTRLNNLLVHNTMARFVKWILLKCVSGCGECAIFFISLRLLPHDLIWQHAHIQEGANPWLGSECHSQLVALLRRRKLISTLGIQFITRGDTPAPFFCQQYEIKKITDQELSPVCSSSLILFRPHWVRIPESLPNQSC